MKRFQYTTINQVRKEVNIWKAACLLIAVIIILTCVIASVIIFALSGPMSSPNTTNFDQFVIKFNKKYQTKEDYNYKKKIFESNLAKINKFNSENHTHKLAINEFADLTDDEFIKMYNLRPVSAFRAYTPVDKTQKNNKIITEPIEPIDWVNNGVVGRIRDQGNCGSCWAFSANSAIESLYALTHNKTYIEFSEQELVDCAGEEYGNFGCNGGDPCETFKYVKTHGISKLKDYPYHARDETCKNKTTERAFFLKEGCKEIQQNSASAMGQELKTKPISIYITAAAFVFRFYKEGIITEGCGDELGHCVNLVGTGIDEKTGQKYWRVRNSWGPNWGDKGYVRVLREDEKDPSPGVCGVNMIPAYPL